MGAGCRCLCGVIFVVLGMDRLIKKKSELCRNDAG